LLKFLMLPSSFEEDGSLSERQHLACLIVNDRVAVDAGSLAMAANDTLRQSVRDVVLTHAHLDHIAGLPLFIDDLFAQLDEPVRVYALQEVIDILERDIFNWSIFPRFSELDTGSGPPIQYCPVKIGAEFQISNLKFKAFPSDHLVPSSGFLISDGESAVAVSGDTAGLDALADGISVQNNLSAILVECAFPNELEEIARRSHHMTPRILADQLERLRPPCPVFVTNIKPNYRDKVVKQLCDLQIDRLELMTVGKPYFW
jgi:cAMP phosphodiesterase